VIASEPNTLAHELDKHWRKHHVVGALIGVRVPAVKEVVRARDHDEEQFHALAAEWLELDPATVRSCLPVGLPWAPDPSTRDPGLARGNAWSVPRRIL
jgi:hypothetical protein